MKIVMIDKKRMSSSNKVDGNYQYFDGINSTQLEDGTVQRVMPNGKMVLSGGAGVTASTGSAKFTTEQANQNQITQGINESTSMVDSNRRSLSESKSFTESEMAEYISNVAQREDSGERFNYESMGERGKMLQDTVSHARQIHDKEGKSWQESTQAAVQAQISVGIPIIKAIGLGAEVSTSGSDSTSEMSDQGVGRDSTASKDYSTNETRNNMIKAMSDKNWAKFNNIDQSLCDRVSASVATEERLGTEVTKNQETLSNYNRALSQSDSQGGSTSIDVTTQVREGIQERYGVSDIEAYKIAQRNSPEAKAVFNEIKGNYLNNLTPKINKGKEETSGASAEKQLNDFTSKHEKVMASHASPSEKVTQYAKQQDFDPDAIRAKVKSQEAKLQKDTTSLIATNEVKYIAAKGEGEIQHKQLENKFEKHDVKGVEDSTKSTIDGPYNFASKDHSSITRPSIVDKSKFEKAKN